MKEYRQLQKHEKRRPRTPTPPTSPVRQSSPILPSSPAFTTLLPRTPSPTINWASGYTPLSVRTRSKVATYVKERTQAAIEGIRTTPSVRHVQEKIEAAAERSMLSGALAKRTQAKTGKQR
jgi:hypothetical protein